MTRFIGYDFGEYENRNYAVYDLSKSEKTKEDFWDNEEECYDIWAFRDYLEENNCILSCDKLVELLNNLHQENQELQEKIMKVKQSNNHYYTEYYRIKEENGQLRGINKEIGDDLYNCRLNKDIVSEKLKLWQDTLAEYDIYTIKDFKELMKNDN